MLDDPPPCSSYRCSPRCRCCYLQFLMSILGKHSNWTNWFLIQWTPGRRSSPRCCWPRSAWRACACPRRAAPLSTPSWPRGHPAEDAWLRAPAQIFFSNHWVFQKYFHRTRRHMSSCWLRARAVSYWRCGVTQFQCCDDTNTRWGHPLSTLRLPAGSRPLLGLVPDLFSAASHYHHITFNIIITLGY